MAVAIVSKSLHKPVSNKGSRKNIVEERSILVSDKKTSNLITFPEGSSRLAQSAERNRMVNKLRTAPGAMADAAAGSFAASENQLEIVLGDDDRTLVDQVTVSPWKKIAALRIHAKNGRTYVGTGWFIGPTVLATAGHCVFLHDAGGWPDKIEVIAELDGTHHPFEIATADKFESSDGWVNDRNSDVDYGAIILNKPISDSIGFFAFGVADDDQLKSNVVNISGYPADRDGATRQYFHFRNITRASSRRVYYEIDTYGGQSGAPVFMNLGEGRRVAVAVHTNGSSTSNYGTRIIEEVFKNLQTWKNL